MLRRKFRRRRRQRTARQPPACHCGKIGAEIMETTYEITRADVGTVIGPANGYLQSVEMTKGPSRYENAVPTPDGLRWASGVFSIRGEGNLSDLICLEHSNAWKRFIALNFAYKGGLCVRSVPVGSEWQIVVSDIPVVRRTYTEAA
jgi:hypothetical protein